MSVTYRLSQTNDPEERLEDAAMWKALCDEYGDQISLTDETPTFGRRKWNEYHVPLPYWNDSAFLSRARRQMTVCSLDEAEHAVADIHAKGCDAFIKSTREKYFTKRFPIGERFREVMGDMVFSFCDEGKCLIVQEFKTMICEYRFVCIARRIVTGSPIAWHLTPIDAGSLHPGAVFETPRSKNPIQRSHLCAALKELAMEAALDLETPDCIIDCAEINGAPGIVEINPMRIGCFGIYACDVRLIAAASRSLGESI